MIKVVVDRSHLLVAMTADGFVTDADMPAAAATLHEAIRSLGANVGRHVTLYDMVAVQAVSQVAIDRFAAFFHEPAYRETWAQRVAFVVRSPLLTRQLKRVCGDREDMRLFDDRTAAVAWLLNAPGRRAAA